MAVNRTTCMRLVVVLTLFLVAMQMASMWSHSLGGGQYGRMPVAGSDGANDAGAIDTVGPQPRRTRPDHYDAPPVIGKPLTPSTSASKGYPDLNPPTASESEKSWSSSPVVPVVQNERVQEFLSGGSQALGVPQATPPKPRHSLPPQAPQSPLPLVLPPQSPPPPARMPPVTVLPSKRPTREGHESEPPAKPKSNLRDTSMSALDYSSRATRELGSRIPFFFHLHKAGGTTLCHNARVVNKLNAPIRNCNAPGDGPRTLRDGIAGFGNANWTCDARRAYMRTHCIQFFAAERWLDDNLCTDHFMYLTVLRDPIKRIESNCRFEKVKPETALNWLHNSHFPEERVYLGTASVDNFYVRSFAGFDVFHRPAGSLTREDLEAAKRQLDNFEVVMTLEQMDQGLVQLRQLLGWKMPNTADSHRSFGSGDVTIKFSDAQRRVLQEKNALDVEFFGYAASLAKQRVAAIRRLSQNSPASIRAPSEGGVKRTMALPGGIGAKECARAFSNWKTRQEQRRRMKERGGSIRSSR